MAMWGAQEGVAVVEPGRVVGRPVLLVRLWRQREGLGVHALVLCIGDAVPGVGPNLSSAVVDVVEANESGRARCASAATAASPVGGGCRRVERQLGLEGEEVVVHILHPS
uniref:Uncharacterized protein n=1 Tax=Oryza rufipogon TaxID=4529 RepID=A0A0E0MYB6_ORYRU